MTTSSLLRFRTTLPLICTLAVCFLLPPSVPQVHAAASEEASEEEAREPRDLIYGYHYPGSLLTGDIERYILDEHKLAIEISYIDHFRVPASPGQYDVIDVPTLQATIASDACPIHALSLRYPHLHQDLLYPLDPADIAEFAPDYYEEIVKQKVAYGHDTDTDEPWYSLPGFRHIYEKSTLLLATTDASIATDTTTVYDPPITEYHPSGFPDTISLAQPVDIHDLEDYMLYIRNSTNSPPMLAWNAFERSFAPLYGAFGVSTVGANLLRVNIASLPTVSAAPAQISNEFKDAIELLQNWYANGLINDDFHSLTKTGAARRAQQPGPDPTKAPPRVLATEYLPSVLAPNDLFRNFVLGHETVTLFEATADESIPHQSRWRDPFVGAEAYLRSCADELPIDALLRVFEYTRWPGTPSEPASMGEGWMRRVFGKDSFYQVSFDTKIVAPYRFRDRFHDPPFQRKKGEYLMWHFKVFPEVTFKYYDETRLLWRPTSSSQDSANYVDQPHSALRPPRNLVKFLNPQQSDQWMAQADQLSRFTREFVLTSIVAGTDLSSEWQDYLVEWMTNGGSIVVDALQASFDSDG